MLYSSRFTPLLCGLAFLLLLLAPLVDRSSRPGAEEEESIDLTELSLEDLLSIKVISVSRKEEPLSETSAAVSVLTAEDIRRSGARSVPEVLRQVPGLQVARVSSSQWAISARGFASEFSNKLLVLIDGRSIYTPLYSGVYWNAHDLMLEDIDRIEVIRGPGATVWGANAVNGVINIITRSSAETQGLLVVAGGGNEENGFSAVRYGGDLGEGITYRAYGKYFDRDEFAFESNEDGRDGWRLGRAGFRADRRMENGGAFTLTGDLFDGRNAQQGTVTSLDPPGTSTRLMEGPLSGGSLLAEWTRPAGRSASWNLQVYGEQTNITLFEAMEDRKTADVELNNNFHLGSRNQVSWGTGFRVSDDRLRGNSEISFDPGSKRDHLYSAYLQDDISLAGGRLRLTVGSKYEHNSYTGDEIQPSARASWAMSDRSNLWCAASRAVRTPSRAEASFVTTLRALPGTAETGYLPILVTVNGSPGLESEDLFALELGYRSRPFDRFAFDVALYHHDFASIIGSTQGDPVTVLDSEPWHVIVPYYLINGPGSTVRGVETSVNWDPTDRWRMRLGYTWTTIENAVDALSLTSGGIDLNVYSQYPEHQATFSSRFDLPRRTELDLFASLVDQLEESGVPAYAKLDIRCGWKPVDHVDLSMAVLDLLDDAHREFQPWASESVEINRRFYARLAWTY